MKQKHIKVKKEDIIKTLKTENLNPRAFITQKSPQYTYDGAFWHRDIAEKQEECKVCAVGAVLREALVSRKLKVRINDFSLICHTSLKYANPESTDISVIKDMVKRKKWMAALSSFFELESYNAQTRADQRGGRISSRHQKYRVKQKTIKFVEENFPKSITVQIG